MKYQRDYKTVYGLNMFYNGLSNFKFTFMMTDLYRRIILSKVWTLESYFICCSSADKACPLTYTYELRQSIKA